MTKNLPTPFTDNSVVQIDGLVVKTGTGAADELAWYNAYRDKSDIPYIVGLKDNSLVMGYVERTGELNVGEVAMIINKYKDYEPLNNLRFSAYIQRIRKHLDGNEQITNGHRLLKKLYNIDLAPTFCHGDLSVSNIIPSATGLKLIDPLYSAKTFGSHILDYAKLLFTIKFYSNDAKKYREARELIYIPYIDTLIASECVRVATYKKQFSFIAENLINEL